MKPDSNFLTADGADSADKSIGDPKFGVRRPGAAFEYKLIAETRKSGNTEKSRMLRGSCFYSAFPPFRVSAMKKRRQVAALQIRTTISILPVLPALPVQFF